MSERLNLFEQIAANKRRSVLLLVLLLSLLGALGGALSGAYAQDFVPGLLIALLIGGGAALFAWFAGSSALLAFSGAEPIEKKDHPQLFNVVEELSIAAGLAKPPAVYVIHDPSPNAFATGRDPEHAAVAITTGLLEKLDRDELQGVMAHELSHVRNYDIRFATIVGVLVGSIALISDLAVRSPRFGFGRSSRGGGSGSGGRGSGNAQVVFLVVALVLAILAPISAMAIQMAISRQREFLADASAAELTRHPEALARALAKLATDPASLRASNRATNALYIVHPKLQLRRGQRGKLFATHPPIEERIRRLKEMGYVDASREA